MGDDGYQFLFRGTHCSACIDDTVNNRQQECSCWCVPDGLNICRIKVDVWGAGAQGSSTICRGLGNMGFSGQFISRILCADTFNSGNYFDGMCFQYVAGQPKCCARCYGGCHGCYSVVCGPNSFTLCAKGGREQHYQGTCYCCSRSMWWWSRECKVMDSGFCLFNTNEPPGKNCANDCPFPENEQTRRACMDKGCCFHPMVRGAYARMRDDDNLRNNCNWRHYEPYPAGINSTYGGYNAFAEITDCCCSCWNCVTGFRTNRPGVYQMGSSCSFQGIVGQGGTATPIFADSDCRCGGPGNGGAVRFTLYPDLSA